MDIQIEHVSKLSASSTFAIVSCDKGKMEAIFRGADYVWFHFRQPWKRGLGLGRTFNSIESALEHYGSSVAKDLLQACKAACEDHKERSA